MNPIRLIARLTATATAAFALLASSTAQEDAGADKWMTDFEAAKAAAKKDNKVILADFTGSDWCGWCIKLKNEVFSTPEFQKWADEKVVLLELDFPRTKQLSDDLVAQNKDLQKKFGIRGFPTIVFMDADGNEVARSGYLKGGPAAWTTDADKKLGAQTAEESWGTDYEAALKQAKKEKKLVMADFTGSDWCGWCIKLKDEVFSTAEFQEWAKEHVVLLELDYPKNKPQSKELKEQNAKLQKEFSIRGYPTVLFLDSKGKQVAQTGYVKGGPEAWIADAEQKLGIKSKKKGKGKADK
ncbi:MAG: thioredoxin family protein [Planctomycetes bacterium]|nr:thioredoxin family protein [Planctomycetota bacterium]